MQEQEQEKLLEEASAVVREQGCYMKRAIHAGNIVPRLYLLVTVGVAFIKSKEAPAADILRDLTELCKGVQHPMRGLFLRFYLTQLCRNVLPDKGSEYEQEGGSNSEDAFLFLLANFTESARLWVRLQQQSSVRDRVKREKERQDLRVLVGSALVRMAQLEGMSVEFYKMQALPAILQQIMACKDTLAQQYLLDCVVQVFSDECHLQTLDLLLAETANVQKGVALKPVLVNLLNRLTSFLQANPEVRADAARPVKLAYSGHQITGPAGFILLIHAALPQDISVFDLFRAFLESQITATILTYSAGGGSPSEPATGGTLRLGVHCFVAFFRGKLRSRRAMDLPSLVALEVAFLNFCLTLFPSRIDYVSQILDGVYRLLAATCQRISTAAPPAGGRSPPSSAKLRGAGLADLSPTTMPGVVAASASARTDTSNLNLKPLPEAGMEALMDLLSAPLRVLSLEVLSIESYAPLMDFLDFTTRNLVASSMVSAVLAAGAPLSSAESLGRFLTLISPLLRDEAPVKRLDEESEAVEETETATRQLQQVAMLIHLANAADTDDHFNLLLVAKSKFAEGGQRRLRILLPPLAVSACRLLLSVLNRQQRAEQRDPDVTAPANGGKKVCQFLHSTCLELVQIDPQKRPMDLGVMTVLVYFILGCWFADLDVDQVALRLWLMAAMAADNANVMVGGYEAICHEFLSQALVCFEEEITESKRQFAALTEMVGCLSGFIRGLDRENYESIASKITQHGAKLLKKPDQCRAVLSCSHLYWNAAEYRDSRRVLECLQKCLKIADICVQASTSHVSLFIEILDKYVYYFDQNNPEHLRWKKEADGGAKYRGRSLWS
ncbi:hypothetical protein Emag_005205 [Eimeria magna]